MCFTTMVNYKVNNFASDGFPVDSTNDGDQNN